MCSLGLGTWFLDDTAWPAVDTRGAKELLVHAWNRGIRHFDTAEAYGNGRAEQVLGQALRWQLRNQRTQLHIATKSVVRPPDSLRSHLERSLRRMQIDFIDTFYIHWPRQGIDLPSAVEELARQRERGLLRRIGLCNVTPAEVYAAERGAPVDTVQFGYNLIWRRPEPHGLTSLPQRKIAYSVLAQGLLARSFDYEPRWDSSDHRAKTPLFRHPLWPEIHSYQQEFLRACRQSGFAPAAVAISWAVEQVDGVLAGARSVGQVDSLIDGLETARKHPTDLGELLKTVSENSSDLQRTLPDLPNMFGYVPTPCRRC